jgi:hypothetical protein
MRRKRHEIQRKHSASEPLYLDRRSVLAAHVLGPGRAKKSAEEERCQEHALVSGEQARRRGSTR